MRARIAVKAIPSTAITTKLGALFVGAHTACALVAVHFASVFLVLLLACLSASAEVCLRRSPLISYLEKTRKMEGLLWVLL